MSNPTIEAERANPVPVRLWQNQIGTGCAVLFLLPFAAAGAFTALRAVQLAQLRSWREALLNTLLALVFGGVGFGGLVGIRFAARKIRDEPR